MSNIYTINNGILQVSADSHGAQLQSILGRDGTEYLWQGDERYWGDRAINLFPYCARLNGNQYKLGGKVYQMTIHGFASSSEYQLTEKTDTSMTFELIQTKETKKAYPYRMNFRICYELEGNVLKYTFCVENLDQKPMYFGLGGHPGFNVPLSKELRFEDYRISFEDGVQPVRFGFSDRLLLNDWDMVYNLENGTIPMDHHLFDDDAIILRDVGHSVTLCSDKDTHAVKVSFPEMDYLGIWHMPHTDAPYVCIEPWCSLPSHDDSIAEFEKQKDLITLPAGEVYQNTWEITLS